MDTDAATSDSEGAGYPHPEKNLVLLQRLHDELNRDLESMNTRLGVALAAALAFVSVAVLQAQIVPGRDLSLSVGGFIRVGLAFGGYVALAIGAIYFLSGLRSGRLASAYVPDELVEPPDAHENLHVFLFRQIDVTYEAIMDRQKFVRRKGKRFNRGTISAGMGIAMLGLASAAGWLGSVWSNHA